MTPRSRPVIPRSQATRDTEDAIAYYLNTGSGWAAQGFLEALEQAYRHIGRFPDSGSPRYAHELGMPGLRCWQLSHYPYLVFYMTHAEHVDVWRLLHGQNDVPGWLQPGS